MYDVISGALGAAEAAALTVVAMPAAEDAMPDVGAALMTWRF